MGDPTTTPSSSASADERSPEQKEQDAFDEALAKRQPRLVAVPLLVLANLATYVALALETGDWKIADWRVLIDWGSNLAPYTASGEPWRLASSMFLHANILHLLINLLVLFDAGRLYERMVGAWRFLLVYLLAGVLGGVASVAWNPWANSVGASGAIFGVLGALIAVMLSGRHPVPWPVLKNRATAVIALVAYSFIDSARGVPIDHEGHLGGLAAGFVLGFILLPAGEIRSFGAAVGRLGAAMAAIAASSAVVGMVLSDAPDLRDAWKLERRFLEDQEWYATVEDPMVEEVRNLVQVIEKPDSAARAAQVAAQAAEAHRRFSAYRLDERSGRRYMHEVFLEYTDFQRRAYTLLAEHAGPGAKEKLAKSEYGALIGKTNEISSRMRYLMNR